MSDQFAVFTENGVEIMSREQIDTIIDAQRTYSEKRRVRYPSADDLHDAKVKKSSSDPVIVTEGEVQEQEYYSKCKQVKIDIPKPE